MTGLHAISWNAVVKYMPLGTSVIRQATKSQMSSKRTQQSTWRAVKLMLKADPGSICAADNQGRIPLYIAYQFGEIEIVKHLPDADKGSLKTCDQFCTSSCMPCWKFQYHSSHIRAARSWSVIE